MPNIGQFLAKMGETGFFFKKAFGTFFSLLKALINCKVSEKSNEGIPRKMRNTSIFGHFGQKWPILDSFLPKMGETGFFFKKALGKFFPPLHALTNCKVSEKIMHGFRETAWRTNGRTDGGGLNSSFLRINIRRTNKQARKGPRINLPTARTNFYAQEQGRSI